MDTPLLLIHFNRPELTKLQIEALAPIAPTRIWVLCDGPRSDRPDDNVNVAKVRELFQELPWECEIFRIYRDKNLGVSQNISSGMSKFFEHCPYGMILEDDCLPSQSFFTFCSELLVRYEDENSVYAISGYTGVPRDLDTDYSYLCASYFSCWGWATWRRAWDTFDAELTGFHDKSLWGEICNRLNFGLRPKLYWSRMLKRVSSGCTNSWAYRYQLTMWRQHGLAIFPKKNLVENIGFGEDATNTAGLLSADVRRLELDFPLEHPPKIEADVRFDRWIEDHWHSKSLPLRLRWAYRKLKSIF